MKCLKERLYNNSMNEPRPATDEDFELNEYKVLHMNEEFTKQYGDLISVGDSIAATMHNTNGRYSVSLYFEYQGDDLYMQDPDCIEIFIDKNDVEFIKFIERVD